MFLQERFTDDNIREQEENIIEDIAVNYHYPEFISIGGHGNPDIINMGGQGEEIVNIDMEDKDQYKNITRYGTPEQVVLRSCSTGRGGVYDEKGNRVNNIANFLADVFNTEVYAASADTNVEHYIFDENGYFQNVIYYKYTSPGVPHTPSLFNQEQQNTDLTSQN